MIKWLYVYCRYGTLVFQMYVRHPQALQPYLTFSVHAVLFASLLCQYSMRRQHLTGVGFIGRAKLSLSKLF